MKVEDFAFFKLFGFLRYKGKKADYGSRFLKMFYCYEGKREGEISSLLFLPTSVPRNILVYLYFKLVVS